MKRIVFFGIATGIVVVGFGGLFAYRQLTKAPPKPVKTSQQSISAAHNARDSRKKHKEAHFEKVKGARGVAACADGKRDFEESDVDCGGTLCPACENDKTCIESADCASGACVKDKCEPWAASVHAGPGYTCARTLAGTVKCWGDNEGGQLGDGTYRGRVHPTDVKGLTSGVALLSTGGTIESNIGFACVVTTASVLKCWGDNADGQLGDETGTGQPAPVDVATIPDVTQMSTGAAHGCLLTKDGGVLCWGRNAHGQLGDGTTTNHVKPEPVVGLPPMAEISVGGDTSGGVAKDGTAWCWGAGKPGRIGEPTGRGQDRPTPVKVAALDNDVASIGVGGRHSCALMKNGSVKCWGDNEDGELGVDNANRGRRGPIDVPALKSGVASLFVGQLSSCVIMTDGGAKCWGHGGDGELGGGNILQSTTPVGLVGYEKTGAHGISLHKWHGCTLTPAGGVACWGSDGHGELGDGWSSLKIPQPTRVILP